MVQSRIGSQSYPHAQRRCFIQRLISLSFILLLVFALAPGQASDGEHQLEFVGGIEWLNTQKPLRLKDLRGKVVLIDFWTYCCINCMHIIPDLKKLEAKYPRELVVIGVHSGKFTNEKGTANIRDAIMRYGIKHPVANDADYKIWQAFGARGWPTLILIDPQGQPFRIFSGEGHYEELDSAIGHLIKEAKRNGSLRQNQLTFAPLVVPKAILSFPGKITAGKDNLFVSDSGHNRILILNPGGKITGVIGSGKEGGTDGNFNDCRFNHPQGLFCKDNLLYIADTENHRIRLANLLTKEVRTIAGTGKPSYDRGGGNALKIGLNSPWDLCAIGNDLFIAMAGTHQLWRLDLKTRNIFPYAGSGREDIKDGPGLSAALAQPSGITGDGKKLYFADSEVSAVRSCDTEKAGAVETLIGKGLFEFGDMDGKLSEAKLQHPLAVLFHDGKLYVADSYNHKIKLIDIKNKTCRTLFGTGKTGNANAFKNSTFSEPSGLAAIGDDLYVDDTNNNVIRVCNLKSNLVKTLPITDK